MLDRRKVVGEAQISDKSESSGTVQFWVDDQAVAKTCLEEKANTGKSPNVYEILQSQFPH